jgi:hypothetical protein
MIVIDPNIGEYIILLFGLLRVRYERTKWWILHNPSNPIVKWLMWRRALRMAKELEKELNK